MRHLSLFSGVGGGDLAHQHLLGWTTVGYVEFDKFCQKVLAQRIKDGFLQEAPIFGDVDSFLESGAAKKYKGYVDVVTAGFPCQPFSVAGKGRGEKDPRNKWPQTIQCIRDVRPRFAFLENVPGLLTSGYFCEILTSLAESGFDVRWDCISAAAVGAPHRRNRLWILAESQHSDTHRVRSHRAQKHQHGSSESEHEQVSQSGSVCEVLADSDNTGQRSSARAGQSSREQARDDARRRGSDVADSNGDDGRPGGSTVAQGGRSRVEYRGSGTGQSIGRSGEGVADSSRLGMEGSGADREQESPISPGSEISGRDSAGSRATHWPPEPQLGRVANGVADRVDRLRACGNGQVSRVAAVAWRLLNESYPKKP